MSGTEGLRSRVSRLKDSYRQFTTPQANGLPRLRVLLSVPALLLLLGIGLVSLGINGSSSGAFYPDVYTGHDPALIAGEPEAIRTDEWNVQTVWAIAQVQQGLPVTNETFPGGGMDATLPQDMPRRDWTVAFRPHLLGFLFLDVNHAIAFKWWVPGLALIAAAFCFVVTILPRRPLLALLLAVGFYYSSFFQWWFLATTLWPVVWALAAMTAVVWALRGGSTLSRWIWAVIVGYLTVVMAMGIYVPFIVPCVLVVVFFVIAQIVDLKAAREKWGSLIWRATPIVGFGILASAVTVAWLASKSSTVNAFLNTAYPGQRTTPTGAEGMLTLASAISSSFTQSLQGAHGFLGLNSSEASTFFYAGAFSLPIAAWIIRRQRIARARQPWVLIGMAAVIVVFVAFMFVPGWDAIAHLLLLDKSTGNRLKIGIGLASFVILPYIVKFLGEHSTRPSRWFVGGLAGLFFLSQCAIALAVLFVAPNLLGHAPLWWLIAIGSAAALYLFGRAHGTAAAAVFCAVCVFSSAGVNPVYSGVLDLRKTAVARQVIKLDHEAPGTWVGIGSRVPTAVLLESGVEAFNGFQGAPSRRMWHLIDPQNKYEFQWNRLAGVSWTGGAGEPQVSNPAADQILATFDGCSVFAQKNVKYVLSDFASLSTSCLVLVKSFKLPHSTVDLYRVGTSG